MSTAQIETAVWADSSGLRCIIISGDSPTLRVALVRRDGLMIRNRSVASDVDAALLAFQWYEENSRRHQSRPSRSASRRELFKLLQ